MNMLPFCVTGLIGGFIAYVFSLFDRAQPLMRLANYPVGVLAATMAAWISQNVPTMHNKLFVLAFSLPSAALVVYHIARRVRISRQRFTTRLESL
jgi:ammonia channel protein AmtB